MKNNSYRHCIQRNNIKQLPLLISKMQEQTLGITELGKIP